MAKTLYLTLIILFFFHQNSVGQNAIIPPGFESSNLPLIIINTGGREIMDEPSVPAHMGIISNSGARNYISNTFNEYNGRISIEIRGKSSQMFPKKSYKIETQDSTGENLNVPLLGMPEENDWVLYAPYTDKSLLRNAFTFEMASKLDFYCSRTAFCELILNDEYKGIYILMEQIKQDDGRVDISKLSPGDTVGDDLTGGYIFKVDKIEPDYREGYSGWKSSPVPSYPGAMDITYQYHDPSPDELNEIQRKYLKNAVNLAEEVLISREYRNKQTGYNHFLNIGSFIDFMIINEMSKEVDKYRYSSYFYKNKDSKGGEIFAGPVWDFNLGYGNVDYWPEGLDYTKWLFDDVYDNDWSIIFWWKRLMEDPFYNDLFTTRWNNLRKTVFSDTNLQLVIDSLANYTQEARLRNFERWPILGTYVWPNYNWQNNTYEDELANFKSWLLQRVHWIDANVSGHLLNPLAEITPVENEEVSVYEGTKVVKVSLFEDYFEHTRLSFADFTLATANPDLYISDVRYLNPSEVALAITSVNPSNPDPSDSQISITIDQKVLTGATSLESQTFILGSPAYRNLQVNAYSADGRIFIRCSEPEGIGEYLEVFNILGQKLGTFLLEKEPLNIISSQLPPDIYLLRFTINNIPYTKKVFIQNY